MLTVEAVEYVGSHQLKVKLSNGSMGLFDVTEYLTKGFFKELANDNYLRLVKVDGSGMGICWPNEQDFSADTLEAELTPIKR